MNQLSWWYWKSIWKGTRVAKREFQTIPIFNLGSEFYVTLCCREHIEKPCLDDCMHQCSWATESGFSMFQCLLFTKKLQTKGSIFKYTYYDHNGVSSRSEPGWQVSVMYLGTSFFSLAGLQLRVVVQNCHKSAGINIIIHKDKTNYCFCFFATDHHFCWNITTHKIY